MFGRKKSQPAPFRFADEPRPSHSGPSGTSEQGVDAALALFSNALGMDLDFGVAHIFAPSLWHVPEIGAMIRAAGIEPNMRGNRVFLLKSPASVARLTALPRDEPIRLLLSEGDFGTALYDPDAENGFSDDLARMQASALAGFAREYHNAEARCYAVLNLHKWSMEVMTGKIVI